MQARRSRMLTPDILFDSQRGGFQVDGFECLSPSLKVQPRCTYLCFAKVVVGRRPDADLCTVCDGTEDTLLVLSI